MYLISIRAINLNKLILIIKDLYNQDDKRLMHNKHLLLMKIYIQFEEINICILSCIIAFDIKT